MIRFERYDYNVPVCLNSETRIWIDKVLQGYNKRIGEIYFLFCSDDSLLKINQRFLNHDYYTDIITFNKSINDNIISGEIFISIERVLDNAKFLGNDYELELHRVLIHGILHLIGFDDNSVDGKEEMRDRERISLSLRSNN